MNPLCAALCAPLLALALAAASIGSAVAAHAQLSPVRHSVRATTRPNPGGPVLDRGTFMGEVTAVMGPAANPTGITVTLGADSIDLHFVVGKTIIASRGLEADVEGLVRGDYAWARAKKYAAGWYATTVKFDVAPIPPLRLLSGVVDRVGADGKRFFLKSDTGKQMFVVRIVKQTRFLVDRTPLAPDAQPAIGKGLSVTVLARKIGTMWTAFAINMRSASG